MATARKAIMVPRVIQIEAPKEIYDEAIRTLREQRNGHLTRLEWQALNFQAERKYTLTEIRVIMNRTRRAGQKLDDYWAGRHLYHANKKLSDRILELMAQDEEAAAQDATADAVIDAAGPKVAREARKRKRDATAADRRPAKKVQIEEEAEEQQGEVSDEEDVPVVNAKARRTKALQALQKSRTKAAQKVKAKAKVPTQPESREDTEADSAPKQKARTTKARASKRKRAADDDKDDDDKLGDGSEERPAKALKKSHGKKQETISIPSPAAAQDEEEVVVVDSPDSVVGQELNEVASSPRAEQDTAATDVLTTDTSESDQFVAEAVGAANEAVENSQPVDKEGDTAAAKSGSNDSMEIVSLQGESSEVIDVEDEPVSEAQIENCPETTGAPTKDSAEIGTDDAATKLSGGARPTDEHGNVTIAQDDSTGTTQGIAAEEENTIEVTGDEEGNEEARASEVEKLDSSTESPSQRLPVAMSEDTHADSKGIPRHFSTRLPPSGRRHSTFSRATDEINGQATESRRVSL